MNKKELRVKILDSLVEMRTKLQECKNKKERLVLLKSQKELQRSIRNKK